MALKAMFRAQGVPEHEITAHSAQTVPGVNREFDGFVTTGQKFAILEAKVKASSKHIKELHERMKLVEYVAVECVHLLRGLPR